MSETSSPDLSHVRLIILRLASCPESFSDFYISISMKMIIIAFIASKKIVYYSWYWVYWLKSCWMARLCVMYTKNTVFWMSGLCVTYTKNTVFKSQPGQFFRDRLKCVKPICTPMWLLDDLYFENIYEKEPPIFFLNIDFFHMWPTGRASHRSAGWGPQKCGWSDGACATTQPRLRHEQAWILIVFSADRRGTGSRHRRLNGDEVRGLHDSLGC